MGIVFNLDEIFEIAEQIERNGAGFYRRAAELTNDEHARKLLSNLADMEDKHERAFSKMRGEFTQPEWASSIDPAGDAALYLRAYASGHVFNPKADTAGQLTGQEGMEDVLHLALGLEKDSIVFYLGMQKMVPKRLGKDKIGSIIKEEMHHITALGKQLEALKQ